MARMAMREPVSPISCFPAFPAYLARVQLLFARIVSWVDVVNTTRPDKLHL